MASGAFQRSNFGQLGKRAKAKLRSDNDIKIIIVGENSQTGIGKTTLAIQLCRFIDDGWDAEEKAFIDVHEYIDAHLNMPSGSALLLDEIEHGADRRRATSAENVELSQAWAKLRNRNIATVATLPSISMLDSRMLELADYWVLVKRRGFAQPYKIRVNDFTGRIQRKPLPGEEHIQFVDLPTGDQDKEHLDQIKDEAIRSEGPSRITKNEHEKKIKQARKEAKMECRNKWFSVLNEDFGLTHGEIAGYAEVGRPRVSQVLNS